MGFQEWSINLLLIPTLVQILILSNSANAAHIRFVSGRNNDSKILGKLGARLEVQCVLDPFLEGLWEKRLGENIWLNMTEFCEHSKTFWNTPCRVEKKQSGRNGSTLLDLIFPKLRRVDLGEYSCGMSLDGSSKERRDNLNDYMSLDEPVEVHHKFKRGTKSELATVGDEVPLTCDLTRGDEEPKNATFQVRWRIHNRWRNPLDLPSQKYSYKETKEETSIIIKSVGVEDAGWYECALWDAKKFPIFTPERILASFEFQLRVRETDGWKIPVITMAVEFLLLSLFMLLVEKTNWFPDGDNSSDEEEDEFRKITGLDYADDEPSSVKEE